MYKTEIIVLITIFLLLWGLPAYTGYMWDRSINYEIREWNKLGMPMRLGKWRVTKPICFDKIVEVPVVEVRTVVKTVEVPVIKEKYIIKVVDNSAGLICP